MKASLYESDFYAWSNHQAALLRAGKLNEADIDNIAEAGVTRGTLWIASLRSQRRRDGQITQIEVRWYAPHPA